MSSSTENQKSGTYVRRAFDSPAADLNGKSILITGGTGSFGRALTSVLLSRCTSARVIVFSRDELKQSEMAQHFPASKHPAIRFFLGDVRDLPRLQMAMRGVDYVVHAAALKQVPAAEYNPIECIRTNVIGAENVVQAALATGVQKVIALSTDKAANPINLYGASKLAADKIFVAANHLSGESGPKYSVARYGNVLGSRGSVVPLFRRLKDEGATFLPITDPRMSRFWITLEQGVNFVLSSLGMMRGGEIFIPKIPSMRVSDLARSIAPGLEHKTVGIRPGEKLHEVMVSSDDARTTYELDDRFVILPAFHFWNDDLHVNNGARLVPEGFVYASDTNPEWLDADDIVALIGG